MACHQAARAAVSNGYKNVFIMPDGIQGWQKSGKQVQRANT
jgi:rhodanese-related sulfurtransferase